PVLGGAPGVYSARYAGRPGADAANNVKLLAELAPYSGDDPAAYYVSTAALADPMGRPVASVEGRCHGFIAAGPRGTGRGGGRPPGQGRVGVRRAVPGPGVRPDVRRAATRGEADDEPPGQCIPATAAGDRTKHSWRTAGVSRPVGSGRRQTSRLTPAVRRSHG